MQKETFKKLLIVLGVIMMIGFMYAYFIHGGIGSPAVKKSSTGICHEEGTLFYKNTKNFTTYKSIEDCLNSGGRLSKK